MDEPKAVSELTERLGRWVEQQPEYPFLFLADRPRRRRAARIIAYRLMILPSVPSESPGRANIRLATRQARRRIGRFLGSVAASNERQRQDAMKTRRRFRRLGMRRAIDLAFADNDARDQKESAQWEE